jgi:hypothetical protein
MRETAVSSQAARQAPRKPVILGMFQIKNDKVWLEVGLPHHPKRLFSVTSNAEMEYLQRRRNHRDDSKSNGSGHASQLTGRVKHTVKVSVSENIDALSSYKASAQKGGYCGRRLLLQSHLPVGDDCDRKRKDGDTPKHLWCCEGLF